MISCTFENGYHTSNCRHVVTDTILYDGDEIVLVRRAPKLVEGGKLALPGGFVDRDETVAEGAKREVLEETGYTIKDQRRLGVIDDPGREPDRQNITFLFSADVDKLVGEPDAESTEIVRIKPSEVESIKEELAFDHYDLIKKYALIND